MRRVVENRDSGEVEILNILSATVSDLRALSEILMLTEQTRRISSWGLG